jgi:predicted GNAT family N-acyltransferase
MCIWYAIAFSTESAYNVKKLNGVLYAMSDRLSTRLLSETISDDDRRTQRRQRMREKYIERLGESPTIEMQRVTPGDGPLWAAIGTLRREVYVDDRHYLPSDVLDDEGREYDEYDEQEGTVHICATSAEGEVVGYARILTKGEDGEDLLPAEKTFGVQLDKKTVEISRLISKGGFPGAPLVTLALVRAITHEINSDLDKYGKAVATLEPFLALHLDNMGVPIRTLVDVQDTPEYNSSNMLVEMDPTKVVEGVSRMDDQRKFSPVYPERLGPWFNDMIPQRGLGRVALISRDRK